MAGDGGRWVRYGSLSFLYFVQGAPYGFQTACLPLLLRQAGLSFSSLGAMKLLFLPWVLKPLYAPLLERTLTRSWWLVASLASMAACCLLAALAIGEADLTALSLLLLALNLASAAQDVCVDSLALAVLQPGELGAGNTIQVVAYKLGAAASGGLLLWCRELLGWAAMWGAFGLLYVAATVLVVAALPRGERRGAAGSGLSLRVLAGDLRQVAAVPGTLAMAAFLLYYKLAERGDSLLPLHLADRGVPLATIALWTGAARSLCSVAGSTAAGWLLTARQVPPTALLRRAAAARCLPAALQLALVASWDSVQPPGSAPSPLLLAGAVVTLCLGALAAGLLTTAAFTAMMGLSREAGPALQASHYSLLSTCEVAGKLACASAAGGLVDSVGHQTVLGLLLLLALLTPPLVPTPPPARDKVL
jgi:hypothetical protein